MTPLIKTLAAVAAGTVLATSAFAQSARETRGPAPFAANRERARPQGVRGGPAARPAGPGRRHHPVPGGELPHLAGGRGGRAEGVAAGRASARYRRRSAVAVGGLEQSRYSRRGPAAGRPAQGEDRIGRRKPQRLPRTSGDGNVYRTCARTNELQVTEPQLARPVFGFSKFNRFAIADTVIESGPLSRCGS